MKKCFLLFLILLFTASAGAAEPARYSDIFYDAFDTVITFLAYADTPEDFSRWSTEVENLYLQYHRLFDRYNAYEGLTNIHTLNAHAAEGPVVVDETLMDLLCFSKEGYEITGGKVNIAMGSVLDLWHDARETALDDPASAYLPSREALEEAAKHTSIEDLILNVEDSTVYFADPLLKLDVGAVAKGYATERIAQTLLQEGLSSFVISAGGNVRIGNPPEDARPNWSIGLQAPDGDVFKNSEYADILYLSNLSVVTSGDYQRYFEVDGVRYCHLIDPDTLFPADTFRSVSIVTEDSGYADLLSTAAFLLDEEASAAFIQQLPDVEAIWLYPDGSRRMTTAIQKSSYICGATNK